MRVVVGTGVDPLTSCSQFGTVEVRWSEVSVMKFWAAAEVGRIELETGQATQYLGQHAAQLEPSEGGAQAELGPGPEGQVWIGVAA